MSDPFIRIPTRDELESRLSVSVPIDERVRYVLGLLTEAERAARGIANLQRDLERERAAKESMAVELRALREKVGHLPPGDRAALEQRYVMSGQLSKARNEIDRLEQNLLDGIKRMREELKKPR